MEMKYGFAAGRWKEKEVWLQNGRVYYVSLEYVVIVFTVDRTETAVYVSVEVLL